MSYRIRVIIEDTYEMDFTAAPDKEHFYVGYPMGAATSREYYENRSNEEYSKFNLIILPDRITISSVNMLADKWDIICAEKDGETHLVFTYIVHPDANSTYMGSLDDEISHEAELGKLVLKDDQLTLVSQEGVFKYISKR